MLYPGMLDAPVCAVDEGWTGEGRVDDAPVGASEGKVVYERVRSEKDMLCRAFPGELRPVLGVISGGCAEAMRRSGSATTAPPRPLARNDLNSLTRECKENFVKDCVGKKVNGGGRARREGGGGGTGGNAQRARVPQRRAPPRAKEGKEVKRTKGGERGAGIQDPGPGKARTLELSKVQEGGGRRDVKVKKGTT